LKVIEMDWWKAHSFGVRFFLLSSLFVFGLNLPAPPYSIERIFDLAGFKEGNLVWIK